MQVSPLRHDKEQHGVITATDLTFDSVFVGYLLNLDIFAMRK